MDAEGTLEQMVETLGDLNIQSWVAVLEHDLFHEIRAQLFLVLYHKRIEYLSISCRWSGNYWSTYRVLGDGVLESFPSLARSTTLAHCLAKLLSTWKKMKPNKLRVGFCEKRREEFHL